MGRRLRPAEWEQIVYRGGGLTLLLPSDSKGIDGHACKQVPVPPKGLSLENLLKCIAAFYQVYC